MNCPPPREVKIRVLQACDLKCAMCAHWQDPDAGHKRLEGDLLRRLLADLGRLGTTAVKLTGGEPTLRSDLPALVAAARDAGLRVTIATNGFALTPARTAALVEAGASTFHVSLDAGVPEVHDRIRGVPGSFARTVCALAHLRDAHPHVGRKIATVVERPTLGHLGPLVPLARELGVREIYLLLVNAEPWCADLQPTLPELARFYFEELPLLLEEGVRRGVRVRPSPIFEDLLGLSPTEVAAALRKGRAAFDAELVAFAAGDYGRCFYARHPCREIQARAEVAETGEVYPCCHGEVLDLAMGNVRQEPFAAIWASERYQAFRDPEGPLPRHPRCLSCKEAHYPA
jgi:radical SAM protein with 4Fe4S-binding SPASM domain